MKVSLVFKTRLINENGLTLIELLFTLTVITFIISLSVPNLIPIFEKQEENKFITLLKQDVLLLQNYSFRNDNYHRIIFRKDHYQIVFARSEFESIIRHYPSHILLQGNTIILNFNKNGTVVTPRTITFKSKYGNKSIVFPFGKGRFYVKDS